MNARLEASWTRDGGSEDPARFAGPGGSCDGFGDRAGVSTSRWPRTGGASRPACSPAPSAGRDTDWRSRQTTGMEFWMSRHTLVFWPSPVQAPADDCLPIRAGDPRQNRDKYSTESAFPRTSHAPLTLQSSTMSAFVQSAFTTGGSTFVRARAQTRRAPTARVRPRISVANAHSNSRSDNTNRPYLLSSLQASGRVSLRVQAIAEGRQSLFVTVNVKPGKMEEYESLIKSHSESTKPHRSIHLPPDAHLPGNRSHELLHERQVHVL